MSTKRAQLKDRDYRVTGRGSQENLSVVKWREGERNNTDVPVFIQGGSSYRC